MRLTRTRQHIAWIVVLCATLAGAWHAVVKPAHVDLDRAVQRRDALVAQIAQEQHDHPEADLARLRAELIELADDYLALWDAAVEPNRIYERLDDMATVSGLTLESIDPRRVRARPRGRVGDEVQSGGHLLHAVGRFHAVARFVGALETGLGVARVDAIDLRPDPTAEDPTRIRLVAELTLERADALVARLRAQRDRLASAGATP